MLPENQFSTLLDAEKAAFDQGFKHHFIVHEEKLTSVETQQTFPAEEVKIIAFNRVEGSSDPDESAILYLIETRSGLKGTLTDAFGIYADAQVSEFMKKIEIDRNDIAGRFESKLCLNCSTPLRGQYCYSCGQRDEHLHEPFYNLLAHGFSDYWHLDSRFIRTFIPLIFNPGFLTREFISGKRASYVHPVRLYFFISVIFFLISVSVFNKEIIKTFSNNPLSFFSLKDSTLRTDLELKNRMKGLSASRQKQIVDSLNKNYSEKISRIIGDTSEKDSTGLRIGLQQSENKGSDAIFSSSSKLPSSVEAYEDSVNRLAINQRPSWICQLFERQLIHLNMRAHENGSELIQEWLESFVHNLPKLFFLLLPIFALIMKLVYIRRKIYLIDHGVFTLYFHSFVFLLFLLVLLAGSVFHSASSHAGLIFTILFIYLLIALKRIYRQSWIKTVVKEFLILFLYGLFILPAALLVLLLSGTTL